MCLLEVSGRCSEALEVVCGLALSSELLLEAFKKRFRFFGPCGFDYLQKMLSVGGLGMDTEDLLNSATKL